MFDMVIRSTYNLYEVVMWGTCNLYYVVVRGTRDLQTRYKSQLIVIH